MTGPDSSTPYRPILIGGMQRSGTSLVRAVIGSAPDVAMFEYDWPLLSRLRDIYGGDLAGRSPRYRRLVASEVLLHPKALRSPGYRALVGELCDDVVTGRIGTYDELVRTFATRYVDASGASRFAMKTPGLERAWPGVETALPKVSFIHVIRNPEDAFVSAQHYGIGDSAEKWALQWRRSTVAGEAAAGDTYHLVRYEDVVDEPDRVARELAAACDLRCTDEMATAGSFASWPGRNSSFDDADQRPTIDERARAQIRAIAGDVMVRWGYATDATVVPAKPSPRAAASDWWAEHDVVVQRLAARIRSL